MELSTVAKFGLADYLVFAAMLLVSSSIGLYFRFSGGKQKTKEEYLLGDHNMPVLPVAFSLMASFMSAITLLGVTQENYTFGTQFVAINLAYIIGTPMAAYLYLPVFYRQPTESASAYSYLERRFGKLTRLLASLAFTLQMVLYMGIVLYAPALALSAVTGMPFIPSILAVGLVCTFYSTLGGLKAVLATDVFQSLLMFAAIFAIIIVGSFRLGGVKEILRIADSGDRLQMFNLSTDLTERHTLWTQLFGGIFTYASIYAVNQTQVQRLLSIGDLKRSQLSLWIQWPILTLLSLSTSLAGLTIYAFYKGCDPILQGRIEKGDQMLPLFVVDTMGNIPGLSGLFVSGIFSGSLSTVSSAINSLAAVTLEDYLQNIPCFKSYTFGTLTLKLLALFYGFLCIGMAFMAEFLGPGVLQASLTIFGVVGGPLLGLFTLGMVFRRANQNGAVFGLLTSMAMLFAVGFGQPRPPPTKLPVSADQCDAFSALMGVTAQNTTISDMIDAEPLTSSHYFYPYRISYAWYALIGFFVTLILGLVGSELSRMAFGSEESIADRDLFMDFIRNRMPVKEGEEEHSGDDEKEAVPLKIREEEEEMI